MRVHCHTNLDVTNEYWPDYLPDRPLVGDIIQSRTKHGVFQLTLKVIRVTWQWSDVNEQWYADVEMHMTDIQSKIPSKSGRGQTGSIIAFFEWYAPLVGRSVGSFI